MDGDRRRLMMNFVNRYQQIVFLSEDWEQKHPELQEIIEPIYKKSYLIQVDPQGLSFQGGLFHPDKVGAEELGLKLGETLLFYREESPQIWERQKGMLI